MTTDDPLSGLSRRELESLAARVAKQLASCVVCEREGAHDYLVSAHSIRASIRLCLPCFERFRLPEGRVSEP